MKNELPAKIVEQMRKAGRARSAQLGHAGWVKMGKRSWKLRCERAQQGEALVSGARSLPE
jgi:hypothetical protein